MQITTAQLNEVAKLIGSDDKATVLNVAIDTLRQAGFTMREAFDAVLGAGAWEKFAGDLYDALRAKS